MKLKLISHTQPFNRYGMLLFGESHWLALLGEFLASACPTGWTSFTKLQFWKIAMILLYYTLTRHTLFHHIYSRLHKRLFLNESAVVSQSCGHLQHRYTSNAEETTGAHSDLILRKTRKEGKDVGQAM